MAAVGLAAMLLMVRYSSPFILPPPPSALAGVAPVDEESRTTNHNCCVRLVNCRAVLVLLVQTLAPSGTEAKGYYNAGYGRTYY